MPNTEQSEVKGKTWKLFTAAAIFALLAGIGAMLYLKVLEHRLEKRLTPAEKEMVSVVVAARDLPTGTTVSTSSMAIRKVPAEYVNSDIITPDRFDAIQGAVLVKQLEHGKMLSQDFIDLNIPKDFSGTIQVGHRAMTIQVDEINSISGMIRPGNYIDLYTRVQSAGRPGHPDNPGEVVIPVLEDVQVLATDNISARPNEDEYNTLDDKGSKRVYNTLTLEVNPREAALIAVAESRGALVAVLRNPKDTGGALFDSVGVSDLFSHSGELLAASANKQHNKSLDGAHLDSQGRIVTRDGTVITDPDVHLTKDGLLVTGNGTVLSGRNLVVGEDGRIRTRDGKPVDTKTLVAGKDGTLVDKDGNVLESNGYSTAKGGFLVDKDGHVITPDGNVLNGVTVGADGAVRSPDGRVITADEVHVGPDGKVRIAGDSMPSLQVDKDGRVTDAAGRTVAARDLVTVGADGTVLTRDGKVLQGVTVGKDGSLYSSDGHKLSASDVLLAEKGFKAGADGTVVDADGKTLSAKDLVTVGEDGKVRAKDGTVLEGAYVDKDGMLRNSDGSPLSAQDVVRGEAVTKGREDEVLAGVTGTHNPDILKTLGKDDETGPGLYAPYEVEYIIGGSSDGAAKTFNVQIEGGAANHNQQNN